MGTFNIFNYLKDSGNYKLLNISYRNKIQDNTVLLDVKSKGLGEVVNDKHLTLRTYVAGPELSEMGSYINQLRRKFEK